MGYRLFPTLTGSAMPLAVLMLTAALTAPAGAAEDAKASPFDALAGEWTGGGTVTPAKGDPLKVACKATYKVSGNALNQHLRCAGVDL